MAGNRRFCFIGDFPPATQFQLWFKTHQLLFCFSDFSSLPSTSFPSVFARKVLLTLSDRRKTLGRCGKELGARYLLMLNASD